MRLFLARNFKKVMFTVSVLFMASFFANLIVGLFFAETLNLSSEHLGLWFAANFIILMTSVMFVKTYNVISRRSVLPESFYTDYGLRKVDFREEGDRPVHRGDLPWQRGRVEELTQEFPSFLNRREDRRKWKFGDFISLNNWMSDYYCSASSNAKPAFVTFTATQTTRTAVPQMYFLSYRSQETHHHTILMQAPEALTSEQFDGLIKDCPELGVLKLTGGCIASTVPSLENTPETFKTRLDKLSELVS